MQSTANQDNRRRMNDSRVISMLRKGPLTRRELQQLTALSWGGVTNTVNRLIESGYIKEEKAPAHKSSGRTPGRLFLTEDDNLVAGIDVNMTGLTGCVMNLSGEILWEDSSPADHSSKEALLECITAFASALIARRPSARFLAAGISMQGEVDQENGVSVKLSQVPQWHNVPLRDIMQRMLNIPVWVAHDPDCMLHACMAETGVKDAVLLRLDENVGMAAAVSGRMITGCGLMEAGHMVIDPSGPRCRCGLNGCLTAYVAQCERSGSPEAFAALAEPLAVTIHNLIQIFRPEKVVLAGDLMISRDKFVPGLERAFARISPHPFAAVEIISDARGAMRGAALIAAENAIENIDIYRFFSENTGGDPT